MDDFLNEYSHAWQQEGKAMEQQLSDLGLDKLHDNIAQHQRRSRRRTLWLSLSSAACLVLVGGLGYHLMMPSEEQLPAVAHNSTPATMPLPKMEHPVPTIPSTTKATIQRKNNTMPNYNSIQIAEDDIAHNDSLLNTLPLSLPETMPSTTIHYEEPMLAQTEQTRKSPVRIVETHSLVVSHPNTTTTHIAETKQLVRIVEPQRNTFREAIVEPLFALACNNQNN